MATIYNQFFSLIVLCELKKTILNYNTQNKKNNKNH